MSDNGKDNEIASLWRAYKEKHEPEVRDRLVEHYLNLVHIIAGRLMAHMPAHVDRDELLSSGFFGLLDAIERFDYTRNNKFETYAGMRIRGEMLDSLRDIDWVSSSMRQKINNYEKVVEALEGKLGRSATDEEIAGALGISMSELVELERKINMSTVMPLDEFILNEKEGVASKQLENIEKEDVKRTLANVINRLPEKERLVVSLYYYEELTMKEIGKVMHLTEARICQLHSKAVVRMRGELSHMKEDLI